MRLSYRVPSERAKLAPDIGMQMVRHACKSQTIKPLPRAVRGRHVLLHGNHATHTSLLYLAGGEEADAPPLPRVSSCARASGAVRASV